MGALIKELGLEKGQIGRIEVRESIRWSEVAPAVAEQVPRLRRYNTERPHDSLGRVPPLTFLPRSTSTVECTSEVST